MTGGDAAARRGDEESAGAGGPTPSANSASRDPVPTRAEFTSAFEELAGSVHALAKRFGRDRRQIYRWLEAYGLDDRRPGPPGRGRG